MLAANSLGGDGSHFARSPTRFIRLLLVARYALSYVSSRACYMKYVIRVGGSPAMTIVYEQHTAPPRVPILQSFRF